MKNISQLTKAIIYEFLISAIIAAPVFVLINIVIGILKAII